MVVLKKLKNKSDFDTGACRFNCLDFILNKQILAVETTGKNTLNSQVAF